MERLRDKPIRLLELGIGKVAGSSKMWNEYFKHPDTRFVVVDRNEERLSGGIHSERWTNVLLDTRKHQQMKEMAEKLGPFDFIIDDCVHAPVIQVNTFNNLWNHVKPGGIYFIEDIGKSYQHGDCNDKQRRKYGIDYFLDHKLHSFVPEPRFLKKTPDIYFLHFYSHICIIGKRNDI